LACASLTFIYFNWQGVKHHGVGHYLLTFAGSPKKRRGLCARFPPVSRGVDQHCRETPFAHGASLANIFASDMLYTIFLSLLVKLTFFALG